MNGQIPNEQIHILPVSIFEICGCTVEMCECTMEMCECTMEMCVCTVEVIIKVLIYRPIN